MIERKEHATINAACEALARKHRDSNAATLQSQYMKHKRKILEVTLKK
jgi:hypothetical protein